MSLENHKHTEVYGACGERQFPQIKIKENNKPDIKKIKFECDDELHKKINKYELSRDFLNRSNTTLLIGRPGSGKTSLLVNLMKTIYKKVFQFIYVVMPENSRKSLADDIFNKHIPKEQIFNELNYETMEHIYSQLKINSANGHKSLLIMDDTQMALKDPLVLRSLKNVICNQRHLGVVNLILLQNYFALDKSIRELVNNIILFKLNKTQMEKIFNEAVETAKDKFLEISNFCFDKPHQWIFINLPTQRIFKQWDELLINNKDDLE